MKIWPIIAVLGLSACYDETAAILPDPLPLNEDAASYYCQMSIVEHKGPKGQLFLAGAPAPIWFGQVRDGLAYLKSPEQEGEILVLYVSDMSKAPSYDIPGEDNWMKAQDAFYVVGSDAIGGMGAPELVPFSSFEKANEFAAIHSGTVLKLDDIPAETVLSPIERDQANPET